jgi:hypothetical protein
MILMICEAMPSIISMSFSKRKSEIGVRHMKTFKVWVDDLRIPPSDANIWVRSVDDAIVVIYMYEKQYEYDTILLDMDHDAGDYAKDGGDYINILNWLEESGLVDTGYSFRLHSMNPVGVQNMRAIIQKNNWKEIS